jgi:SAM-dependent methyltransferase
MKKSKPASIFTADNGANLALPGDKVYVYQPRLRAASFDEAAAALAARIPNPVVKSWPVVTTQSCDQIARNLKRCGIATEELVAPASLYASYLRAADYPHYYPDYYIKNLPEKSFEHFFVTHFLGLNASDVFLDIASEGSPLPDIVPRFFGCETYAQDIMYQRGICGNRIGGDACNMPVNDGFATVAALTCSLEHFEGDSDTRLFEELGRVLRPGGRVCVLPLYLYSQPITVTDPVYSTSTEVQFDPEATVYCARGWGNRHGRHYSAESLVKRILEPTARLFKFQVFYLQQLAEVHPSLYAHFALLAERR